MQDEKDPISADSIVDQELSRCDQLLDKGDIEGALGALEKARTAVPLDRITVGQKTVLAFLLIDLGGGAGREDLVQSGIAVLENLSECLSPIDVEYNLGNAKTCLYGMKARQGSESLRVDSIELLTEAKNHYWRALKLAGRQPDLLVNLANALRGSARLVESLLWYDHALNLDPNFGMAHANRGLALMFINDLSGVYSISLLSEAEKCFRRAEESGQVPESILWSVRQGREHLNKLLGEHGHDQESLAKEEEQHKEEYESHDEYWRFCIANYLALSEHALHCHCAGARRDDLSIATSAAAIGGEFVLPLELLLNRMKSEFCLARSIFFQSFLADNKKSWDLHSFEGTFTELYEGESIGLKAEFLRTSFRLCFGILDRIAQGLNELFHLAEKSEALYFESFWRPHKQKEGKETRWEQLNRQENMGLVALYSLATDLNRARGEWGHFKAFRNELEHGLLILLDEEGKDLPPIAKPARISSETMTVRIFRRRTLQMLQFTASAIFSFVFCVRAEGRRIKHEDAVVVELDKKEIGKD